MTKIFDVTPIEDYTVVIGDKIHTHDQFVVGKIYVSDGELYESKNGFHSSFNGDEVIATLFKRIDNIPLIEIDEDIPDSAIEEIFNCKTDLFQKKEWNWFKKVYKAAQSKKYSEEEMCRFAMFLFTRNNYHGRVMSFDDVQNEFEEWKSVQTKRIPKQVILKVQGYTADYRESIVFPDTDVSKFKNTVWLPVISDVEKNIIHPVNVIF